MATFVLVHGAWQGGWCWRRVADRLRNFGHLVFAPTLTGLGERVHLLNDKIDLDTHIQDVLGVIESEELSNIILCGHSYGGMVITGVADKVPSNVRTLVYLDALVPESGLCTLELLPKEK
ncbi:alpha/beta fold hydrolase [Microbulbifer sp. VAAC004]|uniref:alpha/beta fold hydrolase n=1 Tax=unclassified Microbulbifer TaxID=2619833 RepID=UPI004039EBE0